MFSVIMYGRNDSHGYNLHKRAAISFNAIAEVMSDPDDEILFVDYNTPDDHPTFPEAIHDTLTDKAKKVMRIFRVRPQQHAHLERARTWSRLEAQSRNVALRRSNPRNRWILYTNTDMLLVPRNEDESLSDILGGAARRLLRDAALRAAGDAVGGRLRPPRSRRQSGQAARLGGALPPQSGRAQLHAHAATTRWATSRPRCATTCSPSTASTRRCCWAGTAIPTWRARLALYRGTVDTLIDKVFGYHCDHTRVAAANNKGRADQDERPEPLHLGCRDALSAGAGRHLGLARSRDRGNPSRPRHVLRALLSPASAPRVEPADGALRGDQRRWHLADDLTYDLPHTLPFVCDQVLTYPGTRPLMLVGTRAEFLTRFATAWRGMGFTGPILVPRGMRRPAGRPAGHRRPAHSRAVAAGRDVHLRVRPGDAAQRRAGADRTAHDAARQRRA